MKRQRVDPHWQAVVDANRAGVMEVLRGIRRGEVDLPEAHLATVRRALERHRSRNPKAEPGYGDGKDYTLARLLWLEWWMAWALDQGQEAAVENW